MLLVSLVSFAAQASVTMVGTRVIYAAPAKEQALRFANPDQHPNLVQIWFDRGNPLSRADAEESPFVATPPMFRIEPNSAQVVRLSYVGGALPEDRETLFFLNFLQVPSVKASAADANQLVLTVRSRLKIFYRPQALAGEQDMSRIYRALSFTAGEKDGRQKITAHNPSGYFVVVQHALLGQASPDEVEVAKATLIPPRQEVSWTVPKGAGNASGASLRLKIIDDYGGEAVYDYQVR